MSDKVQLKVYVSEDARDRVNRESDNAGLSNSEYIERLIWEDAHGRSKAGIEARIENKQAQLEAAIQSRDHEQTQVENHRKELQTLKERRSEMENKTGEYQSEIESFEDRLESGGRVFESHKRVREISQKYDKSKYDVLSDVKDTFSDYPETAFRLAKPHEPSDWREAVEQRQQ